MIERKRKRSRVVVSDPITLLRENFLLPQTNSITLFWEFCTSMSPTDPLNVFVDTLGLSLCGPFEVLHGISVEEPHLKWRFFYDLPELVTIAYTKKTRTFPEGFHVCYYRDEPFQEPQGVVSNIPKESCQFEYIGGNMFQAMKACLQKVISENGNYNSASIKKCKKMIQKLDTFIIVHSIDFTVESGLWKERRKKIVANDISRLGIVVPYDKKTCQGYRPLHFEGKELAKVLDECKNSSSESRDESQLQELITWASIAVDEGDFGTGFHLGRTLFLSDKPTDERPLFQTLAKKFLCTAYRLLNREEFIGIVEMHCKARATSSSTQLKKVVKKRRMFGASAAQ